MSKIILFVSYESPWFPAGGIAAVMNQLPGATEAAARRPTVVITPFHEKSAKIAALPLQKIAVLTLPYNGGSIPVTVFHSNAGCPWYFLKADTQPASLPPFFAGVRHPYDVQRAVLLRDSLFFGGATVQALPSIASHQGADSDQVEWNLVAQDWEAATALLAFRSQNTFRGRLHLTLHNSYDEFATTADFSCVGIDPARCPGDTILHRAFSIIEQPAFTVSDQFALDFTHDLLQREVLAPQLQPLLNRSPVAGVDNGPFKPLAVNQRHLRDAAIGCFGSLKDWKASNRHKALTALDAHAPTGKEPVWGDKASFRRDDSPWFVMVSEDMQY